MAIQLNVPVILALHERLTKDLAGAITAINAEISGSAFDYPLENPGEILTFIPPPSDLLAPPVIGIGDAPSRFEDDIGHSATGRHELLIVAYDQSSDQAALAWKLRRWAIAITRVVLDGRNLGAGAWGTGLVATRPGRTLVDNPENPREWFSWVGVMIWAKTEEE